MAWSAQSQHFGRWAICTRPIMVQFYIVLCARAIALIIAGCNQQQNSNVPDASAAPQQTQIERGQHLVETSGCHDCHTPKTLGPRGPEPDMDRALSGHPENVKLDAPYTPAAGSPWIAATNGD